MGFANSVVQKKPRVNSSASWLVNGRNNMCLRPYRNNSHQGKANNHHGKLSEITASINEYSATESV